MATAKLSVELEALTSKYVADLNRAADKLKEFSSKSKQAGQELSVAFTVPLTLLARSAIKSGAELDGLNRSMIAITGSAGAAAKQTKILNEVAKLPGLNFKDSLSGFVQLKAAGFSTELATKSLQNFGNALGILGKTGSLGAVNAQLQQMATRTGSVGEDMRILKAWVPQVGGALQDAFGTQNTELIAQMGFTGKDVVEKLADALGKLPKATGGIGNALENMQDAWFKFTGNMGLAIDKAIDLTGIFDSISEAFTNLAKWFKELDPFWQKTIIGIAGITAVVGPALLALGAMVPLFGNIAIAAGFMARSFLPITIALAAVTVAHQLFTKGWDKFWSDLKSTAVSVSNSIGSVIQNGLGKSLIFLSKAIGDTKGALAIQEKLNSLAIARNGGRPIVIGDQGTDINDELTNKTIKAPSLSKLPTGPKAEEKTDYWKEYLEDQRLASIQGNDFNTVQEKLRVTMAGLKNDMLKLQEPFAKLVSSGMAGQTTDFFKRISDGIKELSERIKNTPISRQLSAEREAINEILSEGAANAITGMAEWVGAFAVGAKSFKDLGTLLKGIFGEIMIATGKQMVVVSKAFIAFKAALTAGTGIGSLGIGLGLIIAGSALKASASKGSSGGYQQVPRGSVSNYQPIYTPYNTGSPNGKISVELIGMNSIRGNDIITSYNQTIYDRSRG